MRNALAAFALLAVPTPALAQPLDVVVSFSILADLVQQVGGEHVAVTSLVGPGEDAHVYEPVPTDVVAVAGADLVVVNGLGFEGFLDRLIEASATQAPVILATRNVDVLASDHAKDDEDDHGHGDEHAHDDDHGHDHGHDHAHDHAHEDAHEDAHDDGHDHGDQDPHAWQSIHAVEAYVATIAQGLCDVGPDHCDAFTANAAAYADQLQALEAELQAMLAPVPVEQRIIITSHDAFGYLARDFELTMLAAQGTSTDSEASAADVAALIDQIRESGARALFIESISDPRLLTQIAEETGLGISGRLYSDALSLPDSEAATYIEMMRTNVSRIAAALAGS